MSFTTKATKAGKDGEGYEKAPAGNHLAILVGIFDMGTQPHEYQGKSSWRRDVCLVWELCGKKKSGSTANHTIAAAVTFSMNEKATLRKWVEARTGKKVPDGAEVDILTELGQPCLLNVVLGSSGFPRVEGVAAVPDALAGVVPAPTYKPTAVTLDQFTDGSEIPEWVPWHYGSPLADHVKACKELGGSRPQPKPKGQGEQAGDAPAGKGDPIPF